MCEVADKYEVPYETFKRYISGAWEKDEANADLTTEHKKMIPFGV